MELKTAISILEHHQEWRLGSRDKMIHEPKKITVALDLLIKNAKCNEELQEEITILKEQLRGTREELAEARKQREEAMKWETDQKFMKSLADENTRLKELVKEAWMAGGAHQSDWHYFYERGDMVTTISLDEWLKSKGI